MARRKNGQDEEGASWMDTYGDMVTLILTFFVLLYSMSSIDSQKWQYIAQAFASHGNTVNAVVDEDKKIDPSLGDLTDVIINEADPKATDTLPDGAIPENFDQLYHYLKNYIDKNGLTENVEITKGASNVYLKFRDNIFFSPDSDTLLDNGKIILDNISVGIKAVDKYILGIKINGYTADAISPTDEWDLSSGRANAVLRYLMEKNICETEKLSSSGYGKYRPIDTNETEEGRKQNRRVEIIIARNDADYSDPKVLEEYFKMEFGDGFVINSNVNGEETVEKAETTQETEVTQESKVSE